MKHCMLLWKKPSAKPLQTQIDCAFDVFSVIRDLREEYSPHFYKANKKKTSQPIAWSADAFMEALKKNPVNKGNQLLGELGYSISMYFKQKVNPLALAQRLAINPLSFMIPLSSIFPMDFLMNLNM